MNSRILKEIAKESLAYIPFSKTHPSIRLRINISGKYIIKETYFLQLFSFAKRKVPFPPARFMATRYEATYRDLIDRFARRNSPRARDFIDLHARVCEE